MILQAYTDSTTWWDPFSPYSQSGPANPEAWQPEPSLAPSCPVCLVPHEGRRARWLKACRLATERARGLVPRARGLFLELLQYGLAPQESAAPAALPYHATKRLVARPPPVRKTCRPAIRGRLRREWRPRGRRGRA